jgi:hypothetical protein
MGSWIIHHLLSGMPKIRKTSPMFRWSTSPRGVPPGPATRRGAGWYLPRKKLGERLIQQHDTFIQNIYIYYTYRYMYIFVNMYIYIYVYIYTCLQGLKYKFTLVFTWVYMGASHLVACGYLT